MLNSGISFFGNEGILQIRSTVMISCFSDLAVQTMRLLNGVQELSNISGQQELTLAVVLDTITPMYTCEVHVMLAQGVENISRTISLQVNSK